MRKTLALCLVVKLSACAGGLTAANTTSDHAPRQSTFPAVASTVVTPSTSVHVGTLVMFGPEQDAWWGLRQATGAVIRLQLNPSEFDAYRVWQNQMVEIEGVPQAPWLSTPVIQVIRIRNMPER